MANTNMFGSHTDKYDGYRKFKNFDLLYGLERIKKITMANERVRLFKFDWITIHPTIIPVHYPYC